MIRKAILALLAAALFTSPAHAEIGRIKQSIGVASIVRGQSRIALSPGVKLEPGDVLLTGKTGRISLTFVDDTRFAVGPNSRVALTEYEYDRTKRRGRFVTSVERGSLAVSSGSIAKSEKDAMKVRTPTSLLGVRGTHFVVDVP